MTCKIHGHRGPCAQVHVRVLSLNQRDESVCRGVGWKRATMAFSLKSTFGEGPKQCCQYSWMNGEEIDISFWVHSPNCSALQTVL